MQDRKFSYLFQFYLSKNHFIHFQFGKYVISILEKNKKHFLFFQTTAQGLAFSCKTLGVSPKVPIWGQEVSPRWKSLAITARIKDLHANLHWIYSVIHLIGKEMKRIYYFGIQGDCQFSKHNWFRIMLSLERMWIMNQLLYRKVRLMARNRIIRFHH